MMRAFLSQFGINRLMSPFLFLKSDNNNADDRGISSLSIVSKVFTAISNKRLYAYTWAVRGNKIIKEPSWFHKGYPAADHIFTLVWMVKRKLNST